MIWIIRKAVMLAVNIGLLILAWHYRAPIKEFIVHAIDFVKQRKS